MLVLFSLLAIVALVIGCTSNGYLALHTLSDSEWNSVGKLRSGKCTLVSNDDVAATTQRQIQERALAVTRSIGKASGLGDGIHATGKVCLLLTSDEDWTKPDIQAQSCGIE